LVEQTAVEAVAETRHVVLPNTYKASESQETNLPLTILSFIAVLER
jgi:hypothetical protein